MKLPIIITSLSLLISNSIFSEEIVWRSQSGDLSVIEVQPEDSLQEVLSAIRHKMEINEIEHHPDSHLATSENQREFLIDFMNVSNVGNKAISKGSIRDYNTKVTANESKDIDYIIGTLGMASLIKIAKEKSSLKKAGERVEHVHPLNFLKIVFTSEKLKAAIYNMQNRGWIWGEFFDGIKRSFEEESNRGNMAGFVNHFASQVKIDPSLIDYLVAERRWKEFINILITKIPRDGNTGRYDM